MILVNWKKLLILVGLVVSFTNSYSAEFTKEELIDLRAKNVISQEDYELLLLEIGEGEVVNDLLYTLKINNKLTSSQYRILNFKLQEYFPVLDFFKQLDIKNYEYINGELVAKIGENLLEVRIDKNAKIISYNGKKEEGNFNDLVIYQDGDIYLRRDLFSKFFLDKIVKNDNLLSMTMTLGFNPPNIVEILADKTQRELAKEKNKKELIYENKGKLFELGNARVELERNYTRNYEDKKSEWDWEGRINYQGSLLYGDFLTGYDFKEKNIENTYLKYEDSIVKSHELEFGSYTTGTTAREWGISLRKNRGYYENGKNYVIEANVPLGSRVELLYYGIPIEIQEEVGGRVTFTNPVIRSESTYFLKIYSPDGKIELREVYTAKTYNHQGKGEIEYDIDFRESHNNDNKIKGNANIYYGLTNNLTLGLGLKREIESIQDRTAVVETGSLEILYSNFIQEKYGYTLELKTERGINLFEDNAKSYLDERYINTAYFQIDINKFQFSFENSQYGKTYDEKNIFYSNIEYRPIDRLRLDLDYTQTKYWQAKTEEDTSLSATYDYKVTNNLLLTPNIAIADDKDNSSYGVDLYYTGFGDNTITWENKWIGKKSEYETKLNMYNSDIFGMLDYNFGISYSKREKEKLTFGITLKYNNFLEMASKLGDMGTRELSLGVDTIFDLRNLKKLEPIGALDSMNVKVTAFIDENNNNIFDNKEKPLKNVDVELGNLSVTTDKNGVAYFTGISSGISLNVKPTIRQPYYTMGETSVTIKGRGTSTLEAYLPVKPMLTLSGIVDIDKKLELSEEEKQTLYSDLIITVKDKSNNIIEITTPDEMGVFSVSGLFTDEYSIEIEYNGTIINIPKLVEKINVAYNDSPKTEVLLAISNGKLKLNKES
jgi:hypothetical protein